MSAKKIAIIGAGMSGMTAAKACIEESLDFDVYERTHFTGCLWRYHDEDLHGVPSVTKSTVINTSKEIAAFSDFPPPVDFPNYMHHSKMVKYFDLYSERFDFNKYVKFGHEIIKLEPNHDYERTGKWIITAQNLINNDSDVQVYDGVMVCTGHHVTPNVPTFRDQEKFKGRIIHTHSYKKPDGFDDKNVAVVGIGNSGADAVVELSRVAKHTYLSTRRGAWIVHRVGSDGRPIEAAVFKRSVNFVLGLLSHNIRCSLAEWFFSNHFDHRLYQLKPSHRILAQHPTCSDSLPDRILNGSVVVKGDIDRFTENGIIFKGENKETECDVVVLATGYHISFPFISKSIINTDHNNVELYKYVFCPKLAHPKTLAFISLVQPLGAIMPIGELQSRWFALLMNDKLSLPSSEQMMADIRLKQKQLKDTYYSVGRHTIQVDYISFMDELAEIIGVKPNLWKYFFSDNKLWRSLFFGRWAPYHYRLEGVHSWSGARQAILTIDERVDAPFKTRFTADNNNDNETNNFMPSMFAFIAFVLIVYLINYLF